MDSRAWRRRGRPRTNRPAVDPGTPELRARRQALAAGADPALTEYPLGLLLARQLISEEQHEAGCYYGFLYGVAIGGARSGCSRLYQQIASESFDGLELNEEEQARIEASFRRGKNMLLAVGRRICDAAENLIVFGRHPGFIMVDGRQIRATLAAPAELLAIREGLDVLVACFGRAAGRRGQMAAHKAPSMIERSVRSVRPRGAVGRAAAPPPASISRSGVSRRAVPDAVARRDEGA